MANKTANTKHKPVRRALRANEYYNPKTKRYEYHYIDAFGKKRVVSSYILEATDQVPKGKRAGQSLREKEAEVNAKLVNNLDIDGSKLTLLEVIDRYLNSLYNRKELAHATKVGYNVTINCLKQYPTGLYGDWKDQTGALRRMACRYEEKISGIFHTKPDQFN